MFVQCQFYRKVYGNILKMLFHLRKSIHSDVWSFGVVCWEIMTRGLTPYGTVQSWEGIEKYITDGKRLEKPNHCDSTIYQVMLQCWNGTRSDRPTFGRLANFLFDHYTKLMNGGMSYYELPNSSSEIEFDKIATFLGTKRGSLDGLDLKDEKFQAGFKVKKLLFFVQVKFLRTH